MANLDFQSNFVHVIDGNSSPTEGHRHGINPATLKPLWDVPVATHGDVDRAAAAAKKAFKSWSRVPYEERRSKVLAYADAVDKHRTQFRDLLTTEQGKPV